MTQTNTATRPALYDWQYRLLATDANIALTVLRLILALVIFPHGAQKLFGWFGGFGIDGTLDYFSTTLGIPYLFGVLAIIAETFGAVALVLGFLGRLAAFGIGCVMTVAVLTSHVQHGFFMNWYGTQQGEGFEFHLLALGIALALMLKGSGALSLDLTLARPALTSPFPSYIIQ